MSKVVISFVQVCLYNFNQYTSHQTLLTSNFLNFSQNIPYDSEIGLDSDGDTMNNDDFDTFYNNVLDENDNKALFDLLNEQFGQFNTPLDSAVVYNEPADDDNLNVVIINSELFASYTNSTIFSTSNIQYSNSSVTS